MDDMEFQNSVNRRFRRARGWLVLVFLAGLGTIVLGQYVLFADSDCPVLQTFLLYASVFVTWIIISIRAVTSRGVTPANQLTRVAMVFFLGLLVPAIVGFALFQLPELRSQFCPTCEKYIETAEDLRVTAEKDPSPLAKLDGGELFARRAFKICGSQKRLAAADVLAHVLFDKAGLVLQNRDCSTATAALGEAASLVAQQGLDPNFGQAIEERERNRVLLCEPTPTPTRTPLPTPTPLPTSTPTPLPTFTPVLPPQPKPDKPCSPVTTYPPTEVIALTLPIASGPPKDKAVGAFLTTEDIAVAHLFDGNETVCLAATRDGRGPLSVDDRLEFFVLADGALVGQWGHDFYDTKSGGIVSGFRPEDVSPLFPRGRYKVKLVLTDLHPPAYSSTAVYLVIWGPRP